MVYVILNNYVQYSEGDYILCNASRCLLLFIYKYHFTVRSLSVSRYTRSTTSFLELWTLQLSQIWNFVLGDENMTLNPWSIIWMSGHWRVVSLRCLHCVAFPPNSHDMMSWQSRSAEKNARSRATECHSVITKMWWYSILYQTGYFL